MPVGKGRVALAASSCVESKRVDAFAEMTDAELDAYLAGRENAEH